MGPRRVDAKRRRIDMAGNPGGLTLDRYAARRFVYGVFGLVLGLVFLTNDSTLFALLTFAFGLTAADALIWQAVRDRREVIDRTLPDFLDVLAVVVSSGLGFRQALDRVAERYEGPWADELRITLRQMDMGVSRRQAFDELRYATPPNRSPSSSPPSSRARNSAHPSPTPSSRSPPTCAAPTPRTPAAAPPKPSPRPPW